LTLGGVGVRLKVEQRTVFDLAALAGAGVDGLLEELGRFPAHDEIGVV
jgi:hypothetical protein